MLCIEQIRNSQIPLLFGVSVFQKGDYKPPYKLSVHPVCTYAEIKYRKVRLRNCHPDHPDPYYEVFDAVRCECNLCNSETTSCENLNG